MNKEQFLIKSQMRTFKQLLESNETRYDETNDEYYKGKRDAYKLAYEALESMLETLGELNDL